jgi:hypothetical protein
LEEGCEIQEMTFNSWLRRQRERDDPIGDLSVDHIDDCRLNKIAYRSIRSLRFVCSLVARAALDEALIEYRFERKRSSP